MAQISVEGNIAKDPEIKFFNDFSVTSFPMAYTPREKTKMGEWVDGETVWFKISVTGKKAENAVDQFAKGNRVIVIGKLKVSTYTDKEGNPKMGLEIRADSIGVIPKIEKGSKTVTKQTGGDDFGW